MGNFIERIVHEPQACCSEMTIFTFGRWEIGQELPWVILALGDTGIALEE